MNTKTTKVYVQAACPTGWARAEKFSDAIREMMRHSRGFVEPEMRLGKFLKMIDEQQVGLTLLEETPDGKFKEVGILGDDFNTAKLIQEA